MENNNININPPETVAEHQEPPKWPKSVFIVCGAVAIILILGLLYIAMKSTPTSLKDETISNGTPASNLAPTLPDGVSSAGTVEQGAYVIPVDSTVKSLSVTVVFKPEKRDKTYDLSEQTGGQSFYLQPSEVSKISTIARATGGEHVLFISDTLKNSAPRNITITTPSGKAIIQGQGTSIETWSAGEVVTMKGPEIGKWQLHIAGSGEFSAKATVVSSITVHGYDFVKLEGKQGREGYYSDYVPIDKSPAIGATQILRVEVLNDVKSAPPPKFQIVSENGAILDSPHFYTIERGTGGTFMGTLTIPKQSFRIMATGLDSKGLPYQRVYGATIIPEKRPAPLSTAELEEFTRTMEALLSEKENIAEAKVQVHDEPLLTSKGNPLGVKIAYTISFPKNHGSVGGLQNPQATGELLRYLVAQKTTVTPALDYTIGYKGGVTYTFTGEYVPFFIRNNGPSNGYCIIRSEAVDEIAQNSSAVKFKLDIPEANYSGQTEHSYSFQSFYRSAVAEGIKDCVY